jgi:transcriptional regulator with XRE-family HTH domain
MVVYKYFALNNGRMANDIRLRLGKRLRILRKKFKLTQEELASRAGISTKYLQNLEGKNPKTASILTIEKIAKGFNITIWQFLKFRE